MDEKITIAVLAGTTRPMRLSFAAAKFVAEVGSKQPGIETIFVDPRNYFFAADGNDEDGRDSRYTEVTADADAFFIVTPEYNHSIPGSLKRMLDSEYDNYFHKPVAFAGVSNGSWGGVRAIEALAVVCRTLGLVSNRQDLHFPRVQDIFDENGTIKPEQAEAMTKRVEESYKELLWSARTLKYGRKNIV